jgi:hypothetical protein
VPEAIEGGRRCGNPPADRREDAGAAEEVVLRRGFVAPLLGTKRRVHTENSTPTRSTS